MKACKVCEIEKDEDEFYWKNKSRGLRMAQCKACRSIASAERWKTGAIKASNYESKARRVQRAQDYIWKVLSNSTCADCGETNPIVFEFDHLGDKFKDIARMVSSNYGVESIKKEISKCQVVCANCHKIRTSLRGNHWRQRRTLIK